ncbi:MAG: DNRLRE domain-containing protein, partial [Sedimenticolaceae bacterium]
VTVTANDADDPSASDGNGGGIFLKAGSTLDVGNSIIAGNTAEGGKNDVRGDFTSSGSNIIQDPPSSTGFAVPETGIDPLLGGLIDNGGNLKTHALLGGSPAIDAADPTLASNTDQRGFLRGDGSPDIGAYEASASAAGTAHYLDRFDTNASFAGDDGVLSWTNDWQEVGEASGPGAGDIRVADEFFGDGGGNVELIVKTNNGVWREADLSGATTATLSFDYARTRVEVDDHLVVYVQSGGGTGGDTIVGAPGTWDEVARYSGAADDAAYLSDSIDISAYIGSDTRILFKADGALQGNDVFFIDNVRIDLATATQETTTLTPVKDTYISKDNPTGNFGNFGFLRMDESGGGLGDGRMLLEFDFSAIPNGATITSAVLQMQAVGGGGNSTVINAYELTEAWDEGSGVDNNDATWNERQTGTAWGTAGGTVGSTVAGSLTTSALGQHSWVITDLVQDWVSGTKTNNGLMLASEDTGMVIFDYDSSESGGTPPQLIVSYSGGRPSTPSGLWLSTTGNVSGSGAPGLDTWQNGEAIQLGDPDLAFEPGTTDGTFSSAANLETLAGTDIDVDALHYVTRDLTTPSLSLQQGDVLFSTNNQETLPSAGTVERDDIILFRPDTAGDYSSGTFSVLVSGIVGGGGSGDDLKALSLIEQDTVFGDITLEAGDFLVVDEDHPTDIYLYRTSLDTLELLISGNDVGITEGIDGLELVERNTTLGDETLAAGELLVSVDTLQGGIGTSNVTADEQDVFRLQAVKTTAVTGTSVADAAILLDGGPVDLDTASEDVDALTMVSSGTATAAPTSTLTVTTVDDVDDGDTSSVSALIADRGADGEISLREAILAANATDGLNTINFDIAGSGPHTINLGAALPNITGTLVIDGTSEPDYGGAPVVRIDGSALTDEDALRLEHGSTGSTIRGLSVTGFSGTGFSAGDAIEIRSDYNTIVGNYLGLATNGTTVAGNEVGVKLRDGADFNTIGGTEPADRNLISGNSYAGVAIREVGTDDNRIIGNWIGLDRNGDVVSAGDHGVVIWDGSYNNQIGGANPGEGNRIAGHNNGVVVDDNIGADPLDNAILGNEIFAVNEMAIDLDNEQVTANDTGDIDSGPNDLLNHPELTGVTQNGADLDIDFDLDVPAGDYRIEFFENPAGIGGIGLGEGQVFLGAVTVTHAGAGSQSFSETLFGVTASDVGSVTSTATEDLGDSYGSTSEFSAPLPSNAIPTLTSFLAPVTAGDEDTEIEVTFGNLAVQG